MRELITTELIRKLPAGPCDIWDTKLPGFVVRVRPNGNASYLAAIGRGCWHTIAPTTKLSPHEARETARGVLGEASKQRAFGRDPVQERKRTRAIKHADLTFKQFIDRHYEPWAVEHMKRGGETVQRCRSVFADLLAERLSALNAFRVEKWRTERLKHTKRPKPATVNSHVTMLKAALNKAVAWKLLTANPLGDIKPLRADKTGRIRYLTADEEKRLRKALDARDKTRRRRRARANAWRAERGYKPYPEDNANHLTPLVLLALNTGLRKGELFNLEWRDIDLPNQRLTVRGEGAKSGQTRYVPLNSEAITTLKDWHATMETHEGYVFAGRGDSEDGRLDDVKKAWLPVVREAKIAGFRFHDLRHTFASKLVMAGVDLNTVRELLGHADLTMTLRYAHLAPEHKAAAVAKLVRA
jgi:integrase